MDQEPTWCAHRRDATWAPSPARTRCRSRSRRGWAGGWRPRRPSGRDRTRGARHSRHGRSPSTGDRAIGRRHRRGVDGPSWWPPRCSVPAESSAARLCPWSAALSSGHGQSRRSRCRRCCHVVVTVETRTRPPRPHERTHGQRMHQSLVGPGGPRAAQLSLPPIAHSRRRRSVPEAPYPETKPGRRTCRSRFVGGGGWAH